MDLSKLPATITNGIPAETRQYIEVIGMPYDDVRERLTRIQEDISDIKGMYRAQEVINKIVENNNTLIMSEKGILVRIRLIEEWKVWWDKMFWAILTGIGAIVVDVAWRVFDHFSK
jgi:rRNA pseudouridine-1189 N-methylase Emg1 (Nep1/Mra1 family)